MAGDWIKVREDLKDDPAVLRMSKATGLDPWAIVGRLSDIWAWIGRHTATGNEVPLDSDMLDMRVHTPGFANAMRAVGWLGGEDGSLHFPEWERHNSRSAKARALEAEAKNLRRSVSGNCPTKTVENVRPEKRREEKKKEHTPAGGEPSAPKAKKEPTSEHAKFNDDWMAYYLKRTGSVYPFTGRDGKAAAQLLKHFGGIEPVKEFIRAVHKRTGDGYPFSNAETLYDFANNIAKLQAALAVGGNGQKPTASLPSSDDLYAARQ